MAGYFPTALVAALGLIIFYLHRINLSWKSIPPLAAERQPIPWTTELIQETYERLKKNPVDFSKHLPPRLDRRYVVVGGSGLVGGDIVLQLLQRGQSPESIRIVDFQPLSRKKMLQNGARACDFVKADITSSASVEAAFAKPWPASVAKLPLTVFHTAALIRPAERYMIFYDRVRKVNVVGAANVLDAARKAGANIFVATSSASVGTLPVRIWGWPWQKWPKRHAQIFDESDFDRPLRPHSEFFANYAYSKAEAERLICGANCEEFRTGTIRPGNGVYGDPDDTIIGNSLKMARSGGPVTTWMPHVIQNFVASRNVSLAHLLLESALLPNSNTLLSPLHPTSGRPYLVTDPGPLVQFASMYHLCETLSPIPYRMAYPPPIAIILLAYAIETWCLFLFYVPTAVKDVLGLAEPSGLVHNLQPALFSVTSHTIADDGLARKGVSEEGLGYKGVVGSLEGMVELLVEINGYEEEQGRREGRGEGKGEGLGEKVKRVVVPKPAVIGA